MKLATLLVLLTYALGARAQDVMVLTDAPFSATWIVTTELSGVVTTSKTVGARSSNGSVSWAIYKDGKPDVILIDDVPREKQVELRVRTQEYTETPARPYGKFLTRTVAEQHAVLEHGNAAYSRVAADQRKDAVPLGKKLVDGMTVYGSHYVRTRETVRTMEGDTWLSDFGFIYSSRYEVFREKKTVTSTLAEMKRGEPDASLFVVPEGYTLVQR